MSTAQVLKARAMMDAVNKHLGDGAVKMANDKKFVVSYIPSGLLPIDLLLGGGIPRGRFIEAYGDYSTLKSYIGLNIVRETQKMGGIAAVIDTEHSFDAEWAEEVGVDLDALIIKRPQTGEEAVDIAEVLTRGGLDFLMFDSIAATLPQDEQGKRLSKEKMQPGRQAHLMSAACRRLTAANDNTAFLWINQTRQKIGITFGSPETTSGGKAMGFYASYRIRLQALSNETRDRQTHNGYKFVTSKEKIAQHFKAEVTKSKLSKPFRDIYFDWDLAAGAINTPMFLVAQGIEHGLVKVKGNTHTYGDKIKSVGRVNFIKKVASDPAVLAELESKIRAKHGLPELTTTKRPRRVVKV